MFATVSPHPVNIILPEKPDWMASNRFTAYIFSVIFFCVTSLVHNGQGHVYFRKAYNNAQSLSPHILSIVMAVEAAGAGNSADRIIKKVRSNSASEK